MDSNLPEQQETQQPVKQGFLKAIVLLKVGIIDLPASARLWQAGFLLVGIVLVLLFGMLNYFNVLRPSALFPIQMN